MQAPIMTGFTEYKLPHLPIQMSSSTETLYEYDDVFGKKN